ncbi:hypothetical protein, partial [Agrobacterium deltaense]|uniref:hypothetical protein n=1 Tax=Agrobacterium deltaense TaxID=1183412 RepID=UPI001968A59B
IHGTQHTFGIEEDDRVMPVAGQGNCACHPSQVLLSITSNRPMKFSNNPDEYSSDHLSIQSQKTVIFRGVSAQTSVITSGYERLRHRTDCRRL